MSYAPEDELFVLMECSEGPFGLGAPEDYRWHAGRPGQSATTDLVLNLEQLGYLTVAEVWDAQGHRVQIQAEITAAGRRRIAELVRDGVKPAPGCL
jgi:hypothetical protein